MSDTLTHLINGEKLGGDAPTGESINPSNLDDVVASLQRWIDPRWLDVSTRTRFLIPSMTAGPARWMRW